jgi:hypothetical protein
VSGTPVPASNTGEVEHALGYWVGLRRDTSGRLLEGFTWLDGEPLPDSLFAFASSM